MARLIAPKEAASEWLLGTAEMDVGSWSGLDESGPVRTPAVAPIPSAQSRAAPSRGAHLLCVACRRISLASDSFSRMIPAPGECARIASAISGNLPSGFADARISNAGRAHCRCSGEGSSQQSRLDCVMAARYSSVHIISIVPGSSAHKCGLLGKSSIERS